MKKYVFLPQKFGFFERNLHSTQNFEFHNFVADRKPLSVANDEKIAKMKKNETNILLNLTNRNVSVQQEFRMNSKENIEQWQR